MGEFSLPLDQMHATGRRINSDVDDLANEMTKHWTQIHDAHARLPVTMQGNLTNFLSSWQQELTDMLTVRQNIGKALIDAANLAEATEKVVQGYFTV